jgi:uncharacterized protein (TIRG00374 family)
VKRLFRRSLVVVLVAIVGYAAFAIWQGAASIQHALGGFGWHFFGLAVLLTAANHIARFIRWEFYLSRLDVRVPSKIDSFLVFMSGFTLTTTPGKVGEVFKSMLLRALYMTHVKKTAPIVVAERVTDLLAVSALIVVGSLGMTRGLIWAGVGTAVVVLMLVFVASRGLVFGTLSLIEKVPHRLAKIYVPKLRVSYQSLYVLVQPRNLVVPTLVATMGWGLESSALWCILQGFGSAPSVPLCVFFYATSILAGALAIVPGGLGVTEAALRGEMRELGHVADDTSTAAMILVRFATLWFTVACGFLALQVLRRRHPELRIEDGVPTLETELPQEGGGAAANKA